MFDNFFNMIFGPIMALSMPYNLMVLSLIVNIFITLVYKYVTDQEMMKSLKEEMKEIQKDLKKFKEDPSKMMAIQKRAMEKQMKMFTHSFKPMLITFIPLILMFGWLRTYYIGLENPDVLFGLSWLWSYIIFSIFFSIVLRKFLRVH